MGKIKIFNSYYELGVDIFYIEGNYYSKESKMIYFNKRLKKMLVKNHETTIEVLSSIHEGDCKFELDEYTPTLIDVVTISNKGNNKLIYAYNESLFGELGIEFYNTENVYISKEYIKHNKITPYELIKKGNKKLYSGIKECYSSGNLMDIFTAVDVQEHNPITDSSKALQESLRIDYSFGLEFETSCGNIPKNELFKHGLIPLRDGSISGHEYATIPMQGVLGLEMLHNQTDILKKYCKINKDCSTHLHLGGFPIDCESIYKLYRLAFSIQDDIKTIFPAYIFNTAMYKSREKDYCNKLDLFSSFEEYYTYLSGGETAFNGSLTLNHPLDERGNAKWNVHSRYLWFNLINMCFKKKGKTVEFRIHTPTFNYDKIIAWITICTIILDAAKKMTLKRISSEGLTMIGLVSESSLSNNSKKVIIKYINDRKAYFKNLSANGDYSGLADIVDDGVGLGIVESLTNPIDEKDCKCKENRD